MQTQTHAPRYFAASNSAKGFRNYYGDCFSEAHVDRLYIIKGGPGTGKSHFMRTVARYAESRGYRVTAYECSSDPSSLDGILLTPPDGLPDGLHDGADSPRIGFLDGTAPHVCEPTVPGVREELINLGVFWDASRLVWEGEKIRLLAEKKAAAYARAYACLAAAGELDALADALVAPAVRADRLRAMAGRLLRREAEGEAFDALPALRSAVSMSGRVTRHTFEAMADSLLILDPSYGLGYRLTAHLFDMSKKKHHRLLVSYHPIYPEKIDGLFYPDSGLCILVGEAEARDGCPTRTVSLRRYANAEMLKSVRSEVRHAVGLRRTLEEDALRHLAEAGKHHFELEAVYASAMDFEEKERFCERFCERLF